jgi:hypothetical protein
LNFINTLFQISISIRGESVVAFMARKNPKGRSIIDESHIPAGTEIAPLSADFSPIMDMI